MNHPLCVHCHMDLNRARDLECPVTPFGNHQFPSIIGLDGSITPLEEN